jgi:hypothetical protein
VHITRRERATHTTKQSSKETDMISPSGSVFDPPHPVM